MTISISGIPALPITTPTSAATSTVPRNEGEGGFSGMLHEAINRVDQLDQDSQVQVADLVQGKRQDLHNVMIAVEKADVAFQLMMQVRNKIVNAYQEVSKLQF